MIETRKTLDQAVGLGWSDPTNAPCNTCPLAIADAVGDLSCRVAMHVEEIEYQHTTMPRSQAIATMRKFLIDRSQAENGVSAAITPRGCPIATINQFLPSEFEHLLGGGTEVRELIDFAGMLRRKYRFKRWLKLFKSSVV